MQSDINDISALIANVRRILDKCERATEQPVSWLDISKCRELCQRVALVADRMQQTEDDGK